MGAVVVFLMIAFLVVMALRAIPSTSRGPDRNPRRGTRRESNDDRDVLWYVPWTWGVGSGDGGSWFSGDGDSGGGGDGGAGGD